MSNDPTPITGPAAHADRCDETTLVAFVAGSLAPAAERKLEIHLEVCPHCRDRLDRLAGSEAEWTSVRTLLADDDEPSTAPFDPERDPDDTALAAALVRTILPCLAPTDDERMLGRLGPYEIAGIVGSGGMGIVLKGHDRSLDRFVAIKVLKPHLATSGAARKRFLREARAAAGIVHDNVIAIHGVGEADGLPYLVMPYCRGTTLAKRLRDRGPLDLRESLRIGMQTARGLAAAHAQGLVHRDVKPANILLDDGVERVLLTDFGLARAADDASLTVTGLLAGTPHYMSPEQALGLPIDARSDLFALGAVLFTIVTGKPPFRAESSHAVLRQVTDVEPADIRRDNPDMPGWFSALVHRLLAKNPAARFQSAAEVAKVLEGCLAHVNDPLVNPLPSEVEIPEPSHRLLAHDQIPKIQETFLAKLRRIMSDQRILAITALMLLLAAVLLPWPIAAVGRDEMALIFAVVAAGSSLLFGWLARGDSLGRLVLRMTAVATLVCGAVVALWSVQSSSGHAQREAAIAQAENHRIQAEMEREARESLAPVQAPSMDTPMVVTTPNGTPQNPLLIPSRNGPHVAAGPDPMPVVGWPSGRTPAPAPTVPMPGPSGIGVPAPALADALAAAPLLPDVPDQAPRSTAPLAPALVPTTLPAEAPPSHSPVAAATTGPVAPAAPTPDRPTADDTKRLVDGLVARLYATERALADGRYVAIADVEIRARDSTSPTTVLTTTRGRIEVTADEPFDLPIPGLMETTTLQDEATTRFLGRSVASIIAELGLQSRGGTTGDKVVLTTVPEPGDGFEQLFEFTFDRGGTIVSKSREIRFRRSDRFRCMNLTKADDFREVAPGLWLPYRISIDYHDYKLDTPDDAIPPLAASVRINIVAWKPTPEGADDDEEPREPAEEGDDDNPLEAAEEADSETEEGMDEEGDAPEENEEERDDEAGEAGEDSASETEDESDEEEDSAESSDEDAIEAVEEMEDSDFESEEESVEDVDAPEVAEVEDDAGAVEDPEAPDFEPAEESDDQAEAPDERDEAETQAIDDDADPFKV